MGVEIRTVRDEDFDAIATLTNYYIVNTPIHFGSDPVTSEELRGSWMKTRERYPFLIAAVDGGFVGYAKAGVWRDRAAYLWTTEVGIYVERGTQGRGVGKALYGTLMDGLRKQGFHSVIGGITLPNEASVGLHEALGFKQVSHVKHAGWKFGKWHDVGFWQVMLREDEHEAGPISQPG